MQKSRLSFFLAFGILYFSQLSVSNAAGGLVVHAVDIGVSKFHRQDNTVHTYPSNHMAYAQILPKDADGTTPRIVNNADKSVTIFISTLDEIVKSVIQVSQQRGEPVTELNISAHGLPGAQWIPANDDDKNSSACSQWYGEAYGADSAAYDHYYGAVTRNDIFQLRAYAEASGAHFPCTIGSDEWYQAIQNNPGIKTAISPSVHINILSCLVGLGSAGVRLTTNLGKYLELGPSAQIAASVNLGLEDWSMPEGMGFWDYQSDEQLEHDMYLQTHDRTDREIMQKGKVRVATQVKGSWSSKVVENQDFLKLGTVLSLLEKFPSPSSFNSLIPEQPRVEFRAGERIRLPQTGADLIAE